MKLRGELNQETSVLDIPKKKKQ